MTKEFSSMSARFDLLTLEIAELRKVLTPFLQTSTYSLLANGKLYPSSDQHNVRSEDCMEEHGPTPTASASLTHGSTTLHPIHLREQLSEIKCLRTTVVDAR